MIYRQLGRAAISASPDLTIKRISRLKPVADIMREAELRWLECLDWQAMSYGCLLYSIAARRSDKVSNSKTIWMRHFFRWSSTSHKTREMSNGLRAPIKVDKPRGIFVPPSSSTITAPRRFSDEGITVSSVPGKRLASVKVRIVDAGSSANTRRASRSITAKTSALARMLILG